MDFLTKMLYAFVFSPIHATCFVRIILFEFISLINFGEGLKLWSSSLCSLLPSLPAPYVQILSSVPCSLCSSLKTHRMTITTVFSDV
jgi:hypothetical protein